MISSLSQKHQGNNTQGLENNDKNCIRDTQLSLYVQSLGIATIPIKTYSIRFPISCAPLWLKFQLTTTQMLPLS